MNKPVVVAVTGAAGRVAYDLLFRLAGGAMLGANQPVELRLLDVAEAQEELEGRAMELHDCAFETLSHVAIGTDERKMFDGADFALLIAGKPRGAGMSRGDLLAANGALFAEQGAALNDVAGAGIKVVVTGNPANTNCAIAMKHAPDIPAERWCALTRLDHDRAKHRLGKKLGVNVADVKKMGIWGNHSSTMFPDVFHTEVAGRNAWERINDWNWLETEFLPSVTERGAEIIKARGASSAASAANATLSCVRDWVRGTDDWVSMAVPSDGSYGVPAGLVCSFPVTVTTDGHYHIVQSIEHSEFAWERIRKSIAELQHEYEAVKALGFV
ncbi:MAG: malate dehydrogenase [Propionibacteriaceae bacterium]|jgi:malate dehydrogenase|nr:malate dehydrogenase [Propionibacteriaceae bacterium]